MFFATISKDRFKKSEGFKVKETKAAEGIVWTTVRSRYVDIYNMYLENYPRDDSKDFPMKPEHPIPTQPLVTKIKGIKKMYRRSLQNGCKYSAGKAVASNYELLQKIWGANLEEDESQYEPDSELAARRDRAKSTRLWLDLIA